MACFLRRTEIELLDGKVYAFRALPFCRKTVQLMSDLLEGDSDTGRLNALLTAVETSLGYDQTPEEVAAILDAGLIPMIPGPDGSPEARIHSAVMGAMVQQVAK